MCFREYLASPKYIPTIEEILKTRNTKVASLFGPTTKYMVNNTKQFSKVPRKDLSVNMARIFTNSRWLASKWGTFKCEYGMHVVVQ